MPFDLTIEDPAAGDDVEAPGAKFASTEPIVAPEVINRNRSARRSGRPDGRMK